MRSSIGCCLKMSSIEKVPLTSHSPPTVMFHGRGCSDLRVRLGIGLVGAELVVVVVARDVFVAVRRFLGRVLRVARVLRFASGSRGGFRCVGCAHQAGRQSSSENFAAIEKRLGRSDFRRKNASWLAAHDTSAVNSLDCNVYCQSSHQTPVRLRPFLTDNAQSDRLGARTFVAVNEHPGQPVANGEDRWRRFRTRRSACPHSGHAAPQTASLSPHRGSSRS